MPNIFSPGQQVRVANPIARHSHTLGQVGRVVERGKAGTLTVGFLGGKGRYHESELELASPEASHDHG
jgi:hypothetical protein